MANASLAKSMGVSAPADLLGKTDFDFHPKRLASQYYDDEQLVLRKKKTLFEHEEESIDVDGNRIALLTTKVPLFDKNGQVIGIAGVGRDITERHASSARCNAPRKPPKPRARPRANSWPI